MKAERKKEKQMEPFPLLQINHFLTLYVLVLQSFLPHHVRKFLQTKLLDGLGDWRALFRKKMDCSYTSFVMWTLHYASALFLSYQFYQQKGQFLFSLFSTFGPLTEVTNSSNLCQCWWLLLWCEHTSIRKWHKPCLLREQWIAIIFCQNLPAALNW